MVNEISVSKVELYDYYSHWKCDVPVTIGSKIYARLVDGSVLVADV